MNRPRNTLSLQVGAYFAYATAKGLSFGLFAAVWVIYLQTNRGMSLSAAALLDISFFLIAAAAEVPTGFAADKFGRTRSISIGLTMMAAGALAWVTAPTLPLILGAYGLLAIGHTFVSGAEDALLYELVDDGGAGRYRRLAGQAAATTMGALAAGSLLGGVLAAIWLPLPFVTAAGGYVAALAAMSMIREPQRVANRDATAAPSVAVDEAAPTVAKPSRIADGMATLWTRPAARWIVLYLTVIPVSALIIETLLVQPQAVHLGIAVSGVGAVVMVLQLAGTIGSLTADRLAARVGERAHLAVVPFLVVLGLVSVAAFQHRVSLGALVVISLATASVRPIAMNRLNAELSDETRATALSTVSLLGTLAAGAAQFAVAIVADRRGLPTSYVVLAGATTIVAALLIRPLGATLRPGHGVSACTVDACPGDGEFQPAQ